MIGHMRHGSPPRFMALQSILSPNRRESLPTPSAGDRMTRRAADFEAHLNREPFVIADRLWVKDHLDPEEEKLRFSKKTRFSPKKPNNAPRSFLSCAWLVVRGPKLQRRFVSSARASLTRSAVGAVPAASSS